MFTNESNPTGELIEVFSETSENHEASQEEKVTEEVEEVTLNRPDLNMSEPERQKEVKKLRVKKTSKQPVDDHRSKFILNLNPGSEYDIAIIDPGYGNFKIALISSKNFRTEFIVQPSVISELLTLDSEDEDPFESMAIEYKGKRYIVGNVASFTGFTVPSLADSWLENLACPVFMLAYCKSANVIHFLLSPSDLYKKELIKAKLLEIKPELELHFSIQGIGIWVESGAPEVATVVDIGYNTVDVLTIIKGKPVKELSFTLRECGLVTFLERLTKDDPSQLARRLESGDSHLLEKVKTHYFPWLENKLSVRPEWRKRPHDAKLIIGGGGALFAPESLRARAFIPEQPQLANVKGYAKIVISDLKRKAKAQNT